MWNKAFVWGWVAILSILIGYELYAVIWGTQDPPLTDVVSRYLPWWITVPFLTWLLLHFAAQYKFPAWLSRFIKG